MKRDTSYRSLSELLAPQVVPSLPADPSIPSPQPNPPLARRDMTLRSINHGPIKEEIERARLPIKNRFLRPIHLVNKWPIAQLVYPSSAHQTIGPIRADDSLIHTHHLFSTGQVNTSDLHRSQALRSYVIT